MILGCRAGQLGTICPLGAGPGVDESVVEPVVVTSAVSRPHRILRQFLLEAGPGTVRLVGHRARLVRERTVTATASEVVLRGGSVQLRRTVTLVAKAGLADSLDLAHGLCRHRVMNTATGRAVVVGGSARLDYLEQPEQPVSPPLAEDAMDTAWRALQQDEDLLLLELV